ncbi:MAG TPA: DUF3616 domain-containing protein [Candidatus Limnocylindrales bacterium]|jgi:hypothetical protein|nr:DUF3616 domain-containing protein [Candidatus Limnocylindrales bacterium]
MILMRLPRLILAGLLVLAGGAERGVGDSAVAASSAQNGAQSITRYKLVRPARYPGMCDASGAVAVSSNLFVVASDEDNVLRLYKSEQPGQPVKEYDYNTFLDVRGKSLEADLEAAARIGNRVFWIGSHGRNHVGKVRENRDRFFATDIEVDGDNVKLEPVGKPYERLLEDLIDDPTFAQFHLAEAALHAPKDEWGLNIEGLAATPEGHLLIGFRNPIPKGKALIIPMLNPNEVVQGQRAKLDAAMQLDLDGLGIRDMAYFEGTYVIIAGPPGGGSHFEVFSWAGSSAEPREIKVKHLKEYHPEAIIIYPEKGLQEIQILSDDGAMTMDGTPCKDKDPSQQGFRSFWLSQRP